MEAAAAEWIKLDWHEETRREMESLLSAYKAAGGDASAPGDSESAVELKKRLGKRIAFGTAGLRARMGAGIAYMNDLVVAQTSQGLAAHVAAVEGAAGKKDLSVAIGYDGRHNSERYARLTAAVFLAKGFTVYLFNRIVATPLVPFAINHFRCAAGIMVTASHNPKEDNGYKVYQSNSAQIIPPTDGLIAQSILDNLTPWDGIDGNAAASIDGHAKLIDPTDEITKVYFDLIKQYSFCDAESVNSKTDLRVVFTAMHGVGKEWVARALAAFGLPEYVPVAEQIEADPEFPTVRFPNPEEAGALDMAMAKADADGLDLVIANDPDSDRLALAEKVDGKWKVFTGNEIALIFADWVWLNYAKTASAEEKKKGLMLSSTVSSMVLKTMAQHEGFTFEDTLTGFKWMGNRAHELEAAGNKFLFAFEVEIGFLIGNISLDKDGVRTAAAMYELAAHWRREGETLTEHVHKLYSKYGFHEMCNTYFFCYEQENVEALFASLRNDGKYVDSVGSYKVESVRDMGTGVDTAEEDGKTKLYWAEGTNMITYRLAGGAVVRFPLPPRQAQTQTQRATAARLTTTPPSSPSSSLRCARPARSPR